MGMRRLAVVVVVVAVLATGCDWGMLRYGPGQTGYNPESTLTPANVNGLAQRWTASKLSGSPIVANGRVYAIEPAVAGTHPDATLDGFDAQGVTNCVAAVCTPVQSIAPHGGAQESLGSPGATGGLLYVGGQHVLLPSPPFPAFTTDAYRINGSRAFETAGGTRTPYITGNTMYEVITVVIRQIGQVYETYLAALDATTGVYKFGMESDNFVSDPAIADGFVYATSPFNGGPAVAAYDANGGPNCSPTDGEHQSGGPWCGWVWGGSAPSGPLGQPVAAHHLVYVTSGTGSLLVYAPDPSASCALSSGCPPQWTASLGTSALQIAVSGSTVFAGSSDGHLYAVPALGCGAATCNAVWSANIGGALSAPSVQGAVVFVASTDHHLYAFDARGCGHPTCTPIWTSADAGAAFNSAPVISDGRVFAIDASGVLHAYALPSS